MIKPTVTLDDPAASPHRRDRTAFGHRRTIVRARTSVLARGEPLVWITGGALVIGVAMILGLLLLVLVQGLSTFWPGDVLRFELADGTVYMGEVTREESYELTGAMVEALSPEIQARAREVLESGSAVARRRLVRTENFDLTERHFHWVNDFAVTGQDRPEWAVVMERVTWGRLYGFPTRFMKDGEVVAEGPEKVWNLYSRYHPEVAEVGRERQHIKEYDFGQVNALMEDARLALRSVELESGKQSEAYARAEQVFQETMEGIRETNRELTRRLQALDEANERYSMIMTTAQGQEATVPLGEVVRAYRANQLGLGGKLSVYGSRWGEFLTDDPRNANQEGGIWPAIVGTVIMTLLMSIAVVPFGVLAALYLREYARPGPMVSTVRIAVNNLAGVPSIVFGVFGLGFFCYIAGGTIDELFFAASLPNPTFGKGGVLWASATLALLTLPVVIVATEEAIAAVPGSMREGSYACGASKWQTIQRIVLPRAMPGIMTGFILAMARGAGEVAPLMLVGVVKMAQLLPIDGVFPYLHPERSFMHLGFHIYDVGFQSQNSEAAKPMVYTTTLLLIAIVAFLNLVAIFVRNRLRKRFVRAQV